MQAVAKRKKIHAKESNALPASVFPDVEEFECLQDPSEQGVC